MEFPLLAAELVDLQLVPLAESVLAPVSALLAVQAVALVLAERQFLLLELVADRLLAESIAVLLDHLPALADLGLDSDPLNNSPPPCTA